MAGSDEVGTIRQYYCDIRVRTAFVFCVKKDKVAFKMMLEFEQEANGVFKADMKI